MKCRFIILTFLFFAFQLDSIGQDIEVSKIEVEAGKYDRENVMVSALLNGINLDLANSNLVLYELDGDDEVLTKSQLEMSGGPRLWWMVKGTINAGKSRRYLLKKSPKTLEQKTYAIEVLHDQGNLIVQSNGKQVLQYNFNIAQLPKGVSEIYNRAGYIHPLWSPKGEVLTRIQPPDHYHHVGLWNPWTHTKFAGKEIDFWNLNKGQGTIKPSTIVSTTSNDLYGGFRVIHDHIDLNGLSPNGYVVALKEEWDVRVWNVSNNAWLIDFTSTMNCATDSAFTILKYRYQGFGFRATKKWNDKTSNLLTSEGKNKKDGNATRARWCDVNGVSEFGTSGVLFITHPANYNYPEPIRIWPEGANKGKENVFFNFNPAMDRDWILEPGNNYQLRYRMYVYDGKIDVNLAEKQWQDFTDPPIVGIEILSE